MPVPTPRLLLLVLVGAVPIALSPSHDLALSVAVIWLIICAVVALVDARMAPTGTDLRFERIHEEVLSLGAWNELMLRARNRSGRSIRFRARDSVPPLLAIHRGSCEGQVPSDAAWTHVYTVYPVHRGRFRLGPLTVRTLGPLGLAWREWSALENDEIRVYPNLLALRQYDSLLRSGRLFQMGAHRSRARGAGTEFERLRSYTPDDEFRRIDWKATARRGAPVVAERGEERSQSIVFALDAGRLMSMRLPLAAEPTEGVPPKGAPPLTRLDYALNAALLLAYVAQSYGDRVGAIAFSDRVVQFVPPRAGPAQLVALTEAFYDLEPEPTEPNFTSAVAALQSGINRRSLVVMFTDVVDRDASRSLVSALSVLTHRHLCLVVTLQDPEVRRLAAQRPTNSQQAYERVLARQVLDERQAGLAELHRLGALTLDVSADRISAAVLNDYLEIKRRARL